MTWGGQVTSRGALFERVWSARAFAPPARKGYSVGDFCFQDPRAYRRLIILLLFCSALFLLVPSFSPSLSNRDPCLLKPPSRNRWVKEISLASMARPQQVRSTPPRQSPGSPSDKENLENTSRSKRKSQTHTMSSSRNNTKRQRLGDRASNIQGGRQQPLSEQRRQASKQFYDPDQDTAERRRVRKGLRDLTRELNGNTPLLIIWSAC